MSSMISPARGLVGRSVLGVLAAFTACGTAAATPVTTWSFGSAHLQHGVYDDFGEPAIQDYDGLTPNITTDPLANGIKLYSPGDGSNTFSLAGESYIGTPSVPTSGGDKVMRGNRLLLTGTGTIDGPSWQDPTDFIRTSFDFGLSFTGGVLDLYEIRSGYLLTDSEGGFVVGVGSGTGLGTMEPGQYGFGLAFEDRFNGPIPTAVNIQWTVEIYFDWTGQNFNDTLDFTIAPNSIDIQAVPAPGAAGLLGLGGAAMLRRRRA